MTPDSLSTRITYHGKGGGKPLVPINDEWLYNRLTSGSKRRYRRFQANLERDENKRNYDVDLAHLFESYVRPQYRKEYFRTKHYLRDLKSSENGLLYSRGVKSYKQLQKAIQRFQRPDHPSFQWNKNYQAAKREMLEEYSKHHLKMVNYYDDESIIATLPKLNTHAGYTYILTGKRSKGDNISGIFKNYQREEELARVNRSFNKPILPSYRTQVAGAFEDSGEYTNDCQHKTRFVSMIDLFQIIAESRFAVPFQKLLATKREYAGGKDSKEISSIISNYRGAYGNFISLDYSAYDQSVSSWLIYDAFDIVRSAFDNVDDDLLSIIISDFIFKNFVMGDGIYYVSKGVPSGSMFTQIIDSIVNMLMVKTYLKATHNKGYMIVMGDDNLVYFYNRVDVVHIATYIMKNFGIVVNPEKTHYGSFKDNPVFLSRIWRADGQDREYHMVISKMLYAERFRNYRGVQVTPEMVLYAYMLTYPITMWRIMDTDKFISENPLLRRSKIKELVDSRYLPGALAYIREYTIAA